ncbi:hypothetical protein FDI95_gp129 [Citrobacter phage CF1 ERZ-2017]|uniref:Uncharacterized protein n=1 Tax=Citrobacter phage CF1 ERZ-2017 TaxID=2267236 RepID=A0A2H4YFP7_9CAUD|nr:hypothetical protein FDI95_gp129 [Citrobacter phage CF1 ERZ-2017]AUE23002.1 hypothetical protein Cf1_00129 [Citrobacter phage CF1 ERZ-2017]
MMKFMFMDGPFRGMVVRTKATKVELNSVPDIPIEFVTGPLEGLITRSLICYDRTMVEAREIKFNPAPAGSYNITMDIAYG